MCLIIYSPEGQLPPREVFEQAKHENPDGIGVMSERAIVRWTGRKGYRKAWKHMSKLADAGVPYAVHFRWRTHGDVNTSQCHPHQTELGSYVMHNGVIGATSGYATATESDTALYVKWYLYGIADWQPVRPLIEGHIGAGNKFVIMDERKEFHIFNEHSGIRHNGLWYSNDYNFPYEFMDELEAQNEGYKAYRGRINSTLGYNSKWWDESAEQYPVVRKSAKESAETLLRKPGMHESSQAWQEYYQELYECGDIDAYELDEIMACHWESDDMTDREDFDDYSDRAYRGR